MYKYDEAMYRMAEDHDVRWFDTDSVGWIVIEPGASSGCEYGEYEKLKVVKVVGSHSIGKHADVAVIAEMELPDAMLYLIDVEYEDVFSEDMGEQGAEIGVIWSSDNPLAM